RADLSALCRVVMKIKPLLRINSGTASAEGRLVCTMPLLSGEDKGRYILRSYRKIEDDTWANGCSTTRLLSFISLYLLLPSSTFIYKASGT
ncbi:MAG: hypothetical protein II314_03795, partial [Prevotella sp.]|nr:hypothetical protein [Prevotella sp.]